MMKPKPKIDWLALIQCIVLILVASIIPDVARPIVVLASFFAGALLIFFTESIRDHFLWKAENAHSAAAPASGMTEEQIATAVRSAGASPDGTMIHAPTATVVRAVLSLIRGKRADDGSHRT